MSNVAGVRDLENVPDLSRRLELEQFVDQDPAITRVINKIEVA